jgi:hypothetical protein
MSQGGAAAREINPDSPSNLVAARNFTRSLNILLKTVRLYGAEHERTNALLSTAWDELRAALKVSGEAGLLLGATNGEVLIDGVPLERRPTDNSFAKLLSAAGLASVHFSPRVTVDDLWRFVRAFANRSPKAGTMTAELSAVLGGEKGAIRVNQVRFIAHDSALSEATVSALLAASSLGPEAQKLQGWLQDPQRMLQLLAAAEGARNQGPGSGGGAGMPASGGPAPQEDDVFMVLRWLSHLGQTAEHADSPEQIRAAQTDLQKLPQSGQVALAQALASMSSQNEPPRPDDPLLVQLAERVAVRFALDRFDRGDVKTNAVVDLLDRLKREIGSLRQILRAHEEKMGTAGVEVESHSDILDRQFWARVPDRAKRKMLLSPEAWAVPPRNVRQFVEQLLGSDDTDSARAILRNYAQCVRAPELEGRRKASAGLSELADLFGKTDSELLKSTLTNLGDALREEGNPDLQTLMGATFVRFSHEAGARRQFPAVSEALQAMDKLERQQPGLARLLWPRVRVGNPLPEFIEEAVRAERFPAGFEQVLRRMPYATVDQVASRVPRCARRDEWARLLEVVEAAGPEAVNYLRRMFQTRPAGEAAPMIALLSRLGPKDLQDLLPDRLRDWDPPAHDTVVRQLANSLAPQRGKLLNEVFELFDRSVLPEVVDEMGMSGDRAASARLMRMIENPASQSAEPYLHIKAIEALGRLREARAESLLRPLVESTRLWRWKHPREVRITAMQSLKKIDPEWCRHFLPRCGLSEAELRLAALDHDPDAPWLRQRRYARVKLPNPLRGVVSPDGTHRVLLHQLSLGGGAGASQCNVRPGSTVPLEINSGLHRVRTRILAREARPQELTFELVHVGFQDRTRLRRPLSALAAAGS